MTIFPAPSARSTGEFNYALCLVLALCLAPAHESIAQSISVVVVGKHIEYVQTSATDVKVNPQPQGPAYGGPYGFSAHVEGQNISGITAPTFSGPVNIAALGSWYNGGKLTYNTAEGAWKSGAPFANDWGSPTLSDLVSKFGNGTYTLTVNGTSVPLQLTGDAYPNAPLLTLSGGTWSNGKYVIDPGKSLTITTNVYTAYGSHPDDRIAIGVEGSGEVGQFSSAVPGTKFMTFTVPASAITAGRTFNVFGNFAALVDLNPKATLPGSINAAFYSASTAVIVSVNNPVFPMVVTSNITPTVANATAAIQYRPQDVGTTGSVYVFALAPANKVTNVSAEALSNHKGPVARSIVAATTATPLPCVLAQLTASGQLTAVTAATMQAYLTGVLSSQGASVSVLNNVSTALVQGAVFYVGYGTTSTAMLNNGVHRNVVTVPGTQVCAPQAPQTGWWWNPAEDGRGFGIEVRGNSMFMSGYLYDNTGHATWIVTPGPVALDGSFFNGTLYQVANGQNLTGTYKAPSPPTTAGSITLSFTDANNGTLVWPGGSIPIQRLDLGSNGTTPSFVPENGWWWNASEDGRGFFMEFKNNFAFIAGYMYETDGRPVWYVTQNPMTTPQSFSSSWLQVGNGQTMTGPYKKPVIVNSSVGPVSIQFTDAANATLTLPGGRPPIAITRLRF